jgi:phage-related protein (TIGR01555 family)
MPIPKGQEAEAVPGALRNFMSNVLPFRGSRAGQKNYPITTPTNLGLTQIHPSRVLEIPGNALPDWRLAPLGGGWGDSVLQTVVDTMKSFTSIQQSVAAMVNDGKMDVVKVPEMSLNMTNQKYKDKLVERFAIAAQTKSTISALLLDKEEDWQRVTTQYGGLPMIMHEFITIVSGAAEIPVSRLFGQAMGRGLSGGSTGSGGEADMTNYYDNCNSKQKTEVAPRMGMLDQVLMRSALGKPDPNIHYEWSPLWTESEADKAKTAYAKAQSTQIYAGLGLINEDALREGVVNQLVEDGTYPGLDDAIEEYGSEPELGDPTGGFAPGGGAAPPGAAGPEPVTPTPGGDPEPVGGENARA